MEVVVEEEIEDMEEEDGEEKAVIQCESLTCMNLFRPIY